LLLLAAAILFSTGGAAIKACSLSNWQVAGFRSGIAAVVLYIALPGARRHWNWRTWLIGLAYAATLVLFVLANKSTTSANAIFLQSTVAAGATLLLFGSDVGATTAPDPVRGNLMALAAGATWGLTITGLRWLGKRSDHAGSSEAVVIAGNLIAFAVCLPMAVPVEHAGLTDVAVLLYLGLFQISLAYVFLTRSLSRVPGLEASTLLLIEPVFNPIWTWMIYGERPGPLALLGGLLIITAAFGGTVWRLK
jgi:drug/metabolite transporter (DMT)-like permease